MNKRISSLILLVCGVSILCVGENIDELKSVYEKEKSYSNALKLINEYAENDNKDKAIEFGKQAFNETDSRLIISRVVSLLSEQKKYEEAFKIGQEALDPNYKGSASLSRKVSSIYFKHIAKDKQEGLKYSKELAEKYDYVWAIRDVVKWMGDMNKKQEGFLFLLKQYPENDHKWIERNLIYKILNNNFPVQEAVNLLVNNIDVKKDNDLFNDLVVILHDQDKVSPDMAQSYCEKLLKRHIDWILMSDDITPKKFNQEMDFNKDFRFMCRNSIRVAQWKRIKNAIPLNGSFSDWKGIAELCKWKIQELSE